MTKLVIILKNKLESIDTILPLINLIKPNECIFIVKIINIKKF